MKKFLMKVSTLSVAGTLASGVAFAQIEVSNSDTGADSTNENDVVVVSTVDEDVDNSADIDNDAVATSLTGGNTTDENTGDGSVESGDAEIDGELENEVNTAVSFYTALFGDVDGELENDTTGADSTNTNDVTVTQTLDVDLANDATLLNMLELFASSGDNSASENTGDGSIETGDADIETGIMNMINWASGSASGSFGDVDVEASNDTTGADSTNENTVVVAQTIDVDVENTADVDNDVVSTALTGGNTSDENTGDGSVETGDAETDTEISNEVNQGGSDSEVELPDVSVEATNDTTGADSTNTNDVTVVSTATVDVTNDATVDNMVDSFADSGGNSSSENTGDGSVETGDAEVTIMISNTVN